MPLSGAKRLPFFENMPTYFGCNMVVASSLIFCFVQFSCFAIFFFFFIGLSAYLIQPLADYVVIVVGLSEPR